MDSGISLARAAPLLGLTTAIFLSGTYFSSSQLAAPILYRLPTATSTDFFKEFYSRGAKTIGPISAIAATAFAEAAYLNPSQRIAYATAAGLSVAPLLFTVLFMKGTIDELVEMAEKKEVREKAGASRVEDLLWWWRMLNYVRAEIALVGGLVGLWTFVTG